MPSLEHYANNASTTLDGGIDASQVTITVASTGGFPAIPQFRILIDNEILLTTGVTGTTWAVARGYEGSTAASHSNGSAVHQVLTSGGLCSVGSQIIQVGAWANRPSPSSGTVGRIYIPTDGYSLAQDNGVSWTPFGPVYHFTPPNNTDFVWVNQGDAPTGATVAASGDAISLIGGAHGNTRNLRLRVKSLAVTGNYRVTVYMHPFPINKSGLGYGVCWRNSSNDRIIILGYSPTAVNRFAIFKFISATSENATYADFNSVFIQDAIRWFRMVEDGSTRYSQISGDGKTWITVHAIDNTDFLTADQVGFWVSSQNAAVPNFAMATTVLHWLEEY